MGHEITETDAMFSVRESTWHGLGTILTDYPTRAEAQAIAHPWEPVAEPLFRKNAIITEAGDLQTVYEEVASVGNFRSDNGAYLGPVSETYVKVDNGEMYDVAEVIQGSGVDVMLETGGSLRGGKDVWLMLRLAEPIAVKGDPHGATIPYFLLQNSHDGSGSFRGQGTNVRVVCKNTSKMADLDAASRGTDFTFSHTKNVADRIEEAKQALAGWRHSITEWQAFSEAMIGAKVTDEQITEFLERYIPAPPPGMATDRVMGNVNAARAEWRGVAASVTNEGIMGTAYGLIQASSEWSEHVRAARSEESAFRRAWMSKNVALASASSLAQQIALV